MSTQTLYILKPDTVLDEDYSPERIREDFGGQRPGPTTKFFRSADYNRTDKAAFKKAGYTYGYVLIYGEKIPAWRKLHRDTTVSRPSETGARDDYSK